MPLDYTVDLKVKRLGGLAEAVTVSVRRIVDETGNYAFVTKTLDTQGRHIAISDRERAEALQRVKSGEGMPGKFR